MTQPEDLALRAAMRTLDPTPERTDAMADVILRRAAMLRRSLFHEWVDGIRERPVAHGALTLAACALAVVGTELGTLLAALGAIL